MRLGCALFALALAATAASFSKPRSQLRVTAGGRMTFQPAAVPRSKAAAIGTDSFAFLTPRHGFAATTGGAGWVPHSGYQQPADAGRIEVTGDGGATWRTVWKRRHVVFGAIAFADSRVGLAAGTLTTGRTPQPPLEQTPVLVATHDGGRSWHVLPRPPFPGWAIGQQDMYEPPPVGTLLLPSRGEWFVFASNASRFGTDDRLWRSTDGGVRWRRVWAPVGTSAVAFPSPSVGYAAAKPRGCRTPEQLWKTTDAGATWTPLPGTCGPGYTSLDFLDAEHGFTSESTAAEFDEYAQHVLIRATTDGGAHWQTRYRAGRWWQVYTRLAFSNPRHGWATSDEWDQGFERTSVHVTSDGGRTWRPVAYPDLPEGFLGGSAWVGPWRTADWGRTWRLSVRPDQVGPGSFLLATTERLFAATDSYGTIESTDGGRTWRTRQTPTPLQLARLTGARAFVSTPSESSLHDPTAFLKTRDGWRPLKVAGAVAFRNGRDGLVASGNPNEEDVRAPVYHTVDGGRTWRQVSPPAGVEADTTLLIAPGVIAIPDDALFVSLDDGRHWQSTSDGSWCSLSRPTQRSIWILCGDEAGKTATLLRSDDAGAHWRRLAGTAQIDASKLVATSSSTAWVVGDGDWPERGAPLWHTTDGGRSWREVWPQVSPRNRGYGLGPS